MSASHLSTRLSPTDSRALASKLSSTAHTLHNRFIGLNEQLHTLTNNLSTLPTSPATYSQQRSTQNTPKQGGVVGNNTDNVPSRYSLQVLSPPNHHQRGGIIRNGRNTNNPNASFSSVLDKYTENDDDDVGGLLEDIDLAQLSSSIARNPSLFDPLKSQKPELGSDGRLIKIDESTTNSINQLKKDVELLLSTIQAKASQSVTSTTAPQNTSNRDLLHDLLHMMAIMYTVDDSVYEKHYAPLCRYFHDFLFHPNSTRHLLFQSNQYNNINGKNNQNNDNINEINDNNSNNIISSTNDNIVNNNNTNNNNNTSNNNTNIKDKNLQPTSPQSLFDLPKKSQKQLNQHGSSASFGLRNVISPRHHRNTGNDGKKTSITPTSQHQQSTSATQSQYNTPTTTPTNSSNRGQAADDTNALHYQQKQRNAGFTTIAPNSYYNNGLINPVVRSNRRTQQGDSEMEAMFDTGNINTFKKHKPRHKKNKNTIDNDNTSNKQQQSHSSFDDGKKKNDNISVSHSKYASDDDDNDSDSDTPFFSGDSSADEADSMFRDIENGVFPTPVPKPYVVDQTTKDKFLYKTVIDHKKPSENGPVLITPNAFHNTNTPTKGNRTPKAGYVMEFIPSAKHRVEVLNDETLDKCLQQRVQSGGRTPKRDQYVDDIDNISDSNDDDVPQLGLPPKRKISPNIDKKQPSPVLIKNNSSSNNNNNNNDENDWDNTTPFTTKTSDGQNTTIDQPNVSNDDNETGFTEEDENSDDDFFNQPRNMSSRQSIVVTTPAHNVPSGVEFINGRWVRSAAFPANDSDDPFSSGDETALDDIPDFGSPNYKFDAGIGDNDDLNDDDDDDDNDNGGNKRGKRTGQQNENMSGDETDDEGHEDDDDVPTSPEPNKFSQFANNNNNNKNGQINTGQVKKFSEKENLLRVQQRKSRNQLPTFDKHTLKRLMEEEEDVIIRNQHQEMYENNQGTSSGEYKNGTIIGDPVVTRRQSIGNGGDRSGSLQPINGNLSISTPLPPSHTPSTSIASPAPAIIRAMTHVIIDSQNAERDGIDGEILPEIEDLQLTNLILQPRPSTDVAGADVLDALSLGSNQFSMGASSHGSDKTGKKGKKNNNNNVPQTKNQNQNTGQNNPVKSPIAPISNKNDDDLDFDLDGMDDEDETPTYTKDAQGKSHLSNKKTKNNPNNNIASPNNSFNSNAGGANSSFKLLQMTPEQVAELVAEQNAKKGETQTLLPFASHSKNNKTNNKDCDLSHSSIGKLNLDEDDDVDVFADFDDDNDVIIQPKKTDDNNSNTTKNNKNVTKNKNTHSNSNKTLGGNSPGSTVLNTTLTKSKDDKKTTGLTLHTPTSTTREIKPTPARKPLIQTPVQFDMSDFDDDDDATQQKTLEELRNKKKENNGKNDQIDNSINNPANPAQMDLHELELPDDLLYTLGLTEQFHSSAFGTFPVITPNTNTIAPNAGNNINNQFPENTRRGRSPTNHQ